MDKKTVNKLLSLNKHFYTQVAGEFSQTRQRSWKGWYKIAQIIKNFFYARKNISVLDLGCGNGRFYGFLKQELKTRSFNYLGLDQNQQLLKEAKQKYGADLFKKLDIFGELNELNKTYHLVVAFGIAHHIPSRELRDKWFSQLASLVKKNGILVFNLWNFNNTSIFQKAKRSIKTSHISIKTTQIEHGDYFLGWRDKKNIYRYCHLYSFKEIEKFIKILSEQNLSLSHKFRGNGNKKKLNHYFIFKKVRAQSF